MRKTRRYSKEYLAMRVLEELEKVQEEPVPGLSPAELCKRIGCHRFELRPALTELKDNQAIWLVKASYESRYFLQEHPPYGREHIRGVVMKLSEDRKEDGFAKRDVVKAANSTSNITWMVLADLVAEEAIVAYGVTGSRRYYGAAYVPKDE